MKRLSFVLICCGAIGLFICADILARGPGGGGRGGGGSRGGGASRGGGGGMSRSTQSRSPSMSRSSSSMSRSSGGMSRPSGGASRPSGGASRPSTGASRPSTGASRPSTGANRPSTGANRPSTGANRPSTGANRPSTGANRPSTGANRPSTGANRPGTGGAGPSQGQLNNFLDLGGGGAGSGGRPSQLPAGGGGAAGDFLQNRPAERPTQRPTERPGAGERPAAGDRQDNRTDRQGNVSDNRTDRQDNVSDNRTDRQDNVSDNRSNRQDNVSDNRGNRQDNLSDNRANRIDNVGQRQTDRVDRRNEVRQQARRYPPRSNFWGGNRYARRWTRPYRWATWGAVASWFPWGWTQPTGYSYGDNVYVEGDTVYYGDNAVGTQAEYGEQAFAIAAGADEIAPDPAADDSEWMSLGVFAMTQDGEASGPAPNLFIQLAVSKEGMIAGTYNNNSTGKSQEIQGVVDKKSQRTAWTVGAEDWPVMETGISNLTKDEAPALIHFADGQTQQWLLVRLEDPDA